MLLKLTHSCVYIHTYAHSVELAKTDRHWRMLSALGLYSILYSDKYGFVST